MINKESYLQRRAAALDSLDKEIARLTEYADSAVGDEVLSYYEAIELLQAKRDQAQRKLHELHAASHQPWEVSEETTGMENAWQDVRKAVLAAISMTSLQCNEG